MKLLNNTDKSDEHIQTLINTTVTLVNKVRQFSDPINFNDAILRVDYPFNLKQEFKGIGENFCGVSFKIMDLEYYQPTSFTVLKSIITSPGIVEKYGVCVGYSNIATPIMGTNNWNRHRQYKTNDEIFVAVLAHELQHIIEMKIGIECSDHRAMLVSNAVHEEYGSIIRS